RQGLSGAMSQGVQRLILQYAGGQNLVRIALETLEFAGSLGGWQMSAFDVGGTPKTTSPLSIPSLAGADGGSGFVEEVTAPFGAGVSYSTQFNPTTTSADNLTPLGNGQPGSLAASDRQAALDALVRIENPRDDSPDTIDCLSCHMAAPLENLVARP